MRVPKQIALAELLKMKRWFSEEKTRQTNLKGRAPVSDLGQEQTQLSC